MHNELFHKLDRAFRGVPLKGVEAGRLTALQLAVNTAEGTDQHFTAAILVKEQDAQFWNLGELGHQEAEQHAFSGAGHAADEGIARIFFALPILPEHDLMQVQIVRRHRRGTQDRNSIAPRIARRFAHIEVMHGCKTGEIARGNLRLPWTP